MNLRDIVACTLGSLYLMRSVGDEDPVFHEMLLRCAKRLGVLIADDRRGTGWYVLDNCGASLMPEPGLVFADQGCAVVFWDALGQPPGARFHAIADPAAQAGALERDELTAPAEPARPGAIGPAPVLRLLPGGRHGGR